jgi:Fe-S-cluster-containing dehydrogenase component/anaerobic selenocysteine-containing dehydrogenase
MTKLGPLWRTAPGTAAEITPARREFLKALALSIGVAQLPGCARAPDAPIVPAVVPTDRQEDQALYYASAVCRDGYANGVLVKTRFGHPIKIEGNVRHPASMGGTDIFAQAAIYGLWSEQRLRNVLNNGRASSWTAFAQELTARLAAVEPLQGEGLHIVSEADTSPTLARLREDLQQRFPRAIWHNYGGLPRDAMYAGTHLACGMALEVFFDFANARRILALDADFLQALPGANRYARDFAMQRHRAATEPELLRLYVAEPGMTATGAMADDRIPLGSTDLLRLAQRIALWLDDARRPEPADDATDQWADRVAADLLAHGGAGIVLVGDAQPAALHALAHRINAQLGNVGRGVLYTAPLLASATQQLASLRQWCTAMQEDQVRVLLTLGGNPVYTAPPDMHVTDLLQRVGWHAHLGTESDETGAHAAWQLPLAHDLESWGDARAFDGTACVLQPTIAPLHDGKTIAEVMAQILGTPRTPLDLVRDTWRAHLGGDADAAWEQCLRDGTIAASQVPRVLPTIHTNVDAGAPALEARGIEVLFRADSTIGDGRHAANAWLQELPKPITQLTWDNAALIAPQTAQHYGLHDEDVVRVNVDQAQLEIAVLIVPGHAADTLVLPLGYGRVVAKAQATCGFDVNRLRSIERMWSAHGTIAPAGRSYPLAITQRHHEINSTTAVAVLAHAQIADFAKSVAAAQAAQTSLYASVERTENAWGMSIDLNACMGCKACTIACQAENNIPTVGKEQVKRGRELHWLRVDGYYEGEAARPRLHFQPVPCMHCEDAPCEVVCPVGATVHDSEGLNLQVYNRCVGTRFCANNCPYKVRRFNFLQFAIQDARDYANPDVTVRNRGVMEKCTYCIQRIEGARIEADRDNRSLRDGDVVTACQAACPTQAIVFGNINDPASGVAKAKNDPRRYALLAELNTRPRTTYLAKIIAAQTPVGSP